MSGRTVLVTGGSRLLRHRPRRPASWPPATGRGSSTSTRPRRASGVEFVVGRRARPRRRAARPARASTSVLHNVAQVPLAQRPRAVLVGERRRHRQRAASRHGDAGVAQGRAHVVERDLRHPGVEPGRRGDAAAAARGLRPGQARGRAAVPRRGRRRARRHDRPAPHDPRPRPARDHGDPVRVRRRRRAGVRARRRRQPLPVRPRRRPRRRLPAGRRPARRRPATTSAPPTFGTMRETLQAWSTTPAPAPGCGRCRSAPGPRRRCRRRRPRRRSRRSRRTTGCSTASRSGSTRPRPQRELGWEPTHSNASMVIESYEWFLAHRDRARRRRAVAPPVAGPHGRAGAC